MAPARFTPFHRGGSGPPLLCLHGFADTWRTWELVLPLLEREHDVLAPTLAGSDSTSSTLCMPSPRRFSIQSYV